MPASLLSPLCYVAIAAAIAACRSASTLPPVTEDVPRIAYTSLQASTAPHIWLANPDGTDPVRLSQGDGDGARISPDGRRVVFESPRNGHAMLFLVGTDGTNEHRLLASAFYGQSATWSPDGLQLAFSHSSNDGSPGGTGSTWAVNADGTNLRQLSPAGADDWLPSWSPDGTRIAFHSTSGQESQLYVMNADGSGRQQITTGPGAKSGPRWSPDGTKLAYTLFPDPAASAASIHIMNADGSGDAAVTDSTGTNGAPAWSPDGTELSFHSNRGGNFRVYRIRTDGANLRPVTSGSTPPGDFNGDWRRVVAVR